MLDGTLHWCQGSDRSTRLWGRNTNPGGREPRVEDWELPGAGNTIHFYTLRSVFAISSLGLASNYNALFFSP